jgi:hypothetical protein
MIQAMMIPRRRSLGSPSMIMNHLYLHHPMCLMSRGNSKMSDDESSSSDDNSDNDFVA